ncbi:MAG: hypothetical protein B7Z27_07565 [Sphingobacteriia bacterium 32-37-4]|nr:MAG: hypothetical protein B7Z27_07565 [Sphingobacteriia bacterium 32-37-4]
MSVIINILLLGFAIMIMQNSISSILFTKTVRVFHFLKAKKLARPITLSEFELDPDEWKKICTENAMVRFLEGGKKIVGKEVTYFDKSLLSHITKDAQKLNKVIGSALNKMTVLTGDAFLVWRLRELSKEGVLVINGDFSKGWKELTIQLAIA